MKFARLIAALLAAGVLALSAGGAARAADPIPLNIAVIPVDSAAQVFYAQDMGFFKAAGLDVKFTNMAASPTIISALLGGSVDIGSSVVGSAASARARNLPVRFIAPAGMWLAATPTARMVTVAGSPLKTPKDFVGKTIAVTGLNDLTFYAVKAWLDAGGVNPDSVKYLELPVPSMVPALKENRVDAALLIEPFYASAGSDVQLVANVDDWVAKRFLATGWLASESWIAAHPEAAAKFAAVMKQTSEWANAHHKESAEILLRYAKLTPEVAAKMVRVTYGTTLDPSIIQPVIDNAAKYGTVARPVTASELIWSGAGK